MVREVGADSRNVDFFGITLLLAENTANDTVKRSRFLALRMPQILSHATGLLYNEILALKNGSLFLSF